MFIGGFTYDEKNYNNGIYRVLQNDNTYKFFYIKNNQLITKKDELRINKLKIPPIWKNVWISINPATDIQVIGTDSKERKQYIYNQTHIKDAEKEKILRLYKFIQVIPNLNKIILEHSKLNPYNKNRVISTMLQIVKQLHLRVGKEKYAKENKSYGISSLKKKHIKILNDVIYFNFKGKSNQRLHYSLYDHNIRIHLMLLIKLEGENLFKYIDENEKIRKINDTDLNQYIQKYMGKQFTIKDFRTYAANFNFIKYLLDETKKRDPLNNNNIKKNIRKAIEHTAYKLRHTKNISKKSYIINFIIDFYFHYSNYFINHKNDDVNDVLSDLINKYKHKIK